LLTSDLGDCGMMMQACDCVFDNDKPFRQKRAVLGGVGANLGDHFSGRIVAFQAYGHRKNSPSRLHGHLEQAPAIGRRSCLPGRPRALNLDAINTAGSKE